MYFVAYIRFNVRIYPNSRRCNCDANDGKERVDAGFFNNTNHLPLVNALFAYTGNPESVGFLTVGPLYCSKHDFGMAR